MLPQNKTEKRVGGWEWNSHCHQESINSSQKEVAIKNYFST
jgi:hypothetical protein